MKFELWRELCAKLGYKSDLVYRGKAGYEPEEFYHKWPWSFQRRLEDLRVRALGLSGVLFPETQQFRSFLNKKYWEEAKGEQAQFLLACDEYDTAPNDLEREVATRKAKQALNSLEQLTVLIKDTRRR